MTYDEILDLLNAKCDENGKATAKLGQDFVLMLSEDYILTLLEAARQNEKGRICIVVLDRENVIKPQGLVN